MPYDEFIKYVKLAIIRYLLACESEENKEITKKTVSNTIFASVLDNINESTVKKEAKAVDTQHGTFEHCSKRGKHLGEVDFDFNQTKPADKSGRHDLIV